MENLGRNWGKPKKKLERTKGEPEENLERTQAIKLNFGL